ncbi:MAG: prepilin peptidase [Candidatus Micrarchaeota archaeon]
MLLDGILFSSTKLNGEEIRIFISFLGLLATTYYDLFNNKNVPNKLLYAFLGLAILTNILFFNQELVVFALVQTLFFGGFFYLMYRQGQMGGADVFALVSLILLLPIHPSITNMTLNYPLVVSLLVFSGVLFALYAIIFLFSKVIKLKGTKPNLFAILYLIPYTAFAYFYLNSFLFSQLYFIIISVLVLASTFFLMYKKDITKALSEKIKLSKVEEEDVVVLEPYTKEELEKYKLPRVISYTELDRLKKLGLNELYIYTKLPPFLPFLLVGLLLSMLFANNLIMI